MEGGIFGATAKVHHVVLALEHFRHLAASTRSVAAMGMGNGIRGDDLAGSEVEHEPATPTTTTTQGSMMHGPVQQQQQQQSLMSPLSAGAGAGAAVAAAAAMGVQMPAGTMVSPYLSQSLSGDLQRQ